MPGIIVGIDGSGHSQLALEWALKEAALRRVPVTVVAVHEAVRGYFSGPTSYAHDPEQTEKASATAREETEKVLATLGEDSRPESVTVHAVHGFPVEEILKAGEDAELIVVGSRGAGGFARMTIGSVAYQVSEHAPCPVTIVRPPHRD
jgi:nucleotide-binding universal stress UspA family protein